MISVCHQVSLDQLVIVVQLFSFALARETADLNSKRGMELFLSSKLVQHILKGRALIRSRT